MNRPSRYRDILLAGLIFVNVFLLIFQLGLKGDSPVRGTQEKSFVSYDSLEKSLVGKRFGFLPNLAEIDHNKKFFPDSSGTFYLILLISPDQCGLYLRNVFSIAEGFYEFSKHKPLRVFAVFLSRNRLEALKLRALYRIRFPVYYDPSGSAKTYFSDQNLEECILNRSVFILCDASLKALSAYYHSEAYPSRYQSFYKQLFNLFDEAK